VYLSENIDKINITLCALDEEKTDIRGGQITRSHAFQTDLLDLCISTHVFPSLLMESSFTSNHSRILSVF